MIPGAKYLSGIPIELSKQAKQRLEWFDYYRSHGNNARLTCRYFGISPKTFYRWKRRYDPYNLRSLEDRSRRPKHLRQPTASPELVEAVLRLREKYPRWGKDKIVILVREEGFSCSTVIDKIYYFVYNLKS
jgi:transposase